MQKQLVMPFNLKQIATGALEAYNLITQGKVSKEKVLDDIKKAGELIGLCGIAFSQVDGKKTNVRKAIIQLEAALTYLKDQEHKVNNRALTNEEIEALRALANKVGENLGAVSQVIRKTGLAYSQSEIVLKSLQAWSKGEPTPKEFKNLFR